jgi:hypothetical protein
MRVAKLLVPLALAAATLPGAPPASASGPAVVVFDGTARLPVYPGARYDYGYDGSFDTATAAGADTGGGPVTRLTMRFDYRTWCSVDEPLHLEARGVLHTWHGSAQDPGRPVNWQSVGLVAIFDEDTYGEGDGIGVSTFVPDVLPSCSAGRAYAANVAMTGVLLLTR